MSRLLIASFAMSTTDRLASVYIQRLPFRPSSRRAAVRVTAFVVCCWQVSDIDLEGALDMGMALAEYIVDIDGCLRSTDREYLSRADVLELYGHLKGDAIVGLCADKQVMLLGKGDQVKLHRDRVTFFRTSPVPHFMCSVFAGPPFAEKSSLAMAA